MGHQTAQMFFIRFHIFLPFVYMDVARFNETVFEGCNIRGCRDNKCLSEF